MDNQKNKDEIEKPNNLEGMTEKFLLEERKIENEYTIPQKLLLESLKCNHTQFDVLKILIINMAYECGFIGEWIDHACNDDDVDFVDLSNLSLNWCYSFDRRIFEYCSMPNNINDSPLKLIFKFTLDQKRKIILNCTESGDLGIITAYDLRNLESKNFIKSQCLVLPFSRYIPFRKLFHDNISASFRNLNELACKVKENLFLPLRNAIYQDSKAQAPTPWLNGMPDCILIKIFKSLKRKDVLNLCCTSRRHYDVYKAFVHNKKRKFE